MCSERLLDVFCSSLIFPFDTDACSMSHVQQFSESISVKINKAAIIKVLGDLRNDSYNC